MAANRTFAGSPESLSGVTQRRIREDSRSVLDALPISSQAMMTEQIPMKSAPGKRDSKPPQGFRYRVLDVFTQDYGEAPVSIAVIRLTPKGAYIAERLCSGGVGSWNKLTNGGSVPRKLVRGYFDLSPETELWLCKRNSGKYAGIGSAMRHPRKPHKVSLAREPRVKNV